jgi:hypothetical protein
MHCTCTAIKHQDVHVLLAECVIKLFQLHTLSITPCIELATLPLHSQQLWGAPLRSLPGGPRVIVCVVWLPADSVLPQLACTVSECGECVPGQV